MSRRKSCRRFAPDQPPPLQNKLSETTTKAKRCLSILDRALQLDLGLENIMRCGIPQLETQVTAEALHHVVLW